MLKVDLINLSSPDYIPLALHYLKLFAETHERVASGVRIEILEPVDPKDIESVLATTVDRRPDVVGFSCYVWNVGRVVALARRLRERLPGVRIVCGGPELASDVDGLLDRYPEFDVIVRGEGEVTFQELLLYWLGGGVGDRTLDAIDGLVYRDEDSGCHRETAKRAIITDLDIIPSPYASGSIDLANEKRTILLETYRGCPFKCSFCYYPKDFGPLIHSFSLDRVRSDLELILASNARDLLLMDPTFNIPPKRAKQILTMIADLGTDSRLSISTELRVDLLDDELIELLPRTNIRVVEIGLQTADGRILESIDRRQNLERIRTNAARIKDLGIPVVVQLISGLPGDTTETYLRSLEYCFEIDADRIDTYPLFLLVGTPLYRSASDLGLEFVDDPPRVVTATPSMSADDLQHGRNLDAVLDLLWNRRAGIRTLRWLGQQTQLTLPAILNRYVLWRESGEQPPLDRPSLVELWHECQDAAPRIGFEDWQLRSGLDFDGFFTEWLPNLELARIASEFIRFDYYMVRTRTISGLLQASASGRSVSPLLAIDVQRFRFDVSNWEPDGTDLSPVPHQAPQWIQFAPSVVGDEVRNFFHSPFIPESRSRPVSESEARRLLGARRSENEASITGS